MQNSGLSNSFFQAIFSNNQDGMAIIDDDFNIIESNQAFLDITKYKTGELSVLNLLDLISQGNIIQTKQAITLTKNGTAVEPVPRCYLNKQGHKVHVLETLTAIPENNWVLITLRDLTEKDSLHQQVDDLVHFDHLTKLLNRQEFTQYFANRVEQTSTPENIYICYLDLDNFKRINNHFGHNAGDELIVSVAKRIKHHLVAGETASRFGGDEFIILLIAENKAAAKQRITQLTEQINAPFVLESTSIPVQLNCSVGITHYSKNFNELDTLIRQADQAMYLAKQPNYPAIYFFSQKDFLKTISRQQQLVEISQAIKNNEMEMYYQPKINLRTGKVMGFEALVRWQHPKNGIILPEHFIPIIEETSVIERLDCWVMNKVVEQAHNFQQEGYAWPVSINVSNRMFHDENFINHLAEQLNKYPNLPNHNIEIEVLESVAITDFKKAKEIMLEGNKLGIKFVLDDFGTGYSSISYLKNLPFDTVKIDKMFIQTMLSYPQEMEVVEAIINLAKVFNLNVIAEGVESIEHGIVLLRYHCNNAQGFGITKSLPADKVIPWTKQFIPDPSWELWSDALWDMQDFPLLVAKSDHIVWIEQVLINIKDPELKTDEKDITDEKQCRFGQWYYGIAKQQYSHLESYQKIEAIHHEVHKTGLKIYQLKALGDINKAKTYAEKLLLCRDQILQLLDQLQRDFIKQAKKSQ